MRPPGVSAPSTGPASLTPPTTPTVVNRGWSAARQAGYSDYFPNDDSGYITDDHLFVNRLARIPMIDIVPYHPIGDHSFGPTWHTLQDSPDNIAPATLKAVGQTLLQLIFTETN